MRNYFIALLIVVSTGCGGSSLIAPSETQIDRALQVAWENPLAANMPREARPHVKFVAPDPNCTALCGGAWIDDDGNATVTWAGNFYATPGFPTVLAKWRVFLMTGTVDDREVAKIETLISYRLWLDEVVDATPAR